MVTALQARMLTRIARDELTELNGDEPETAAQASTYADRVIEDAEDKGTFTSLLNAELVWHAGKKRDAIVGLTEAGFAAYKALASPRTHAKGCTTRQDGVEAHCDCSH